MLHKHSKNKIVSISLTLILLLSLLANICTVGASAVTPRWTNINSINLNMSFDGGDGNASGVSSKKSTATMIEGTLVVYKLVNNEWIYIDEGYNSRTRGTLAVSVDFVCEKGATYKSVFTVTAYNGTLSETETMEYIDTCP